MRLCNIKNKFVEEYLRYTKYTETPEIMHIWCAISCLAGAAERRVWLDRGMFNLHPNLFIVLVGPPGVVAKTTSIGFMSKLLRASGNYIVDQVATKEKIVVELLEHQKIYKVDATTTFPHSSITFAMSEINTLLTAGQDMVLFLTSIWDQYELYCYKTKTSGEFEIVNPYFNMIGAATPDWFMKAIDSEMLSTGFLARCILVYASNKRAKISKPTFSQEQKEAKEECIKILNWVNTLYGVISVDEDAEQFYHEWYVNLPDHLSKDPKLGGYFERKAKVFILKLASLLAIGDCRKNVTILDLENALKIFDVTEPALKACYLLTGGNKLAPVARNLMRALLMNEGKISYPKMLQLFYNEVNIDELAQVVTLLRNMDLVTMVGSNLVLSNPVQAKEFLGEF